jgi:hypothetical protein
MSFATGAAVDVMMIVGGRASESVCELLEDEMIRDGVGEKEG